MMTTTRQRILEIIKANEPLAVCAKIADEIDERDAEIDDAAQRGGKSQARTRREGVA